MTSSEAAPESPTQQAPLLVEQHGAVLRIVLNRPRKRNALNAELQQALLAALALAEQTAQTSVVVLSGAGEVFCAGVDLAEVRAPQDAAATRARLERLAHLQRQLAALSVPLLVAVNGAAVGAGAVLALCGDGILMAEPSSFAFPELAQGIAPYLVAPLLTQRVGRFAAFELLARGAPLPAASVVARGWANAVVPAAQLMAQADAWATELARVPRAVLVNTKAIMRAVDGNGWADALSRAVGLY